MKHKFKFSALLVAASAVFGAFSANAANTFYAPGDLVLFFQQEGGTNTVYANLGAATAFRGSASGAADGTNSINFLNLNTTLTSAFGAGWASDTSIYAGLAGVYSTNGTANTVVNGDPYRTLYVSASREDVGTVGQASSAGYTVTTNTGMTNGATGITQMNTAFENNYDALTTVSLTSVSTIDDTNTFLAPGIQGVAFNIFASGVQQQGSAGSFGTFGDAGEVEFSLDLYRILAKEGLAGQVAGTGTIREGTYEGSVTLNSSGMVSFVAVPEPSSTALIGLAAGALVLRRRRSA